MVHRLEDAAKRMSDAADRMDAAAQRLAYIFEPGYGGYGIRLVELMEEKDNG